MYFDRLAPGQRKLNGESENRLRTAVEGLIGSAGANAIVSPTDGIVARRSPAPASAQLTRMKVKAVFGVGSHFAYLRAVEWDGTTEIGDQVWVLKAQGHAVDDNIIAQKVRHGTGQTAGTSGSYVAGPVEWLEMLYLTPSPYPSRVIQVMDSTGKLAIETHTVES